jgi:hypothetical protein
MDKEIKIPNDWAPTSELKRQRQQSLNFDIWSSESNLFDLRRIKSDFSISTMDNRQREPQLQQQQPVPQFAPARYPMPQPILQPPSQSMYQRELDQTAPKVIRYSPSRTFRGNEQFKEKTRKDWQERENKYSARVYENANKIPQWPESAIYKQSARIQPTHEWSNMATMPNVTSKTHDWSNRATTPYVTSKTSHDWPEGSVSRQSSRDWSDSKSIVQKPSLEWSDGGSRQHSRQWSEGSNKPKFAPKGSREWAENTSKGLVSLTSGYPMEEEDQPYWRLCLGFLF